MLLPPTSWKRREKSLREQHKKTSERSKISLTTRKLPPALCRRCPCAQPLVPWVGSHGTSLRNYVHEHLFVRGHQRICFFPGCMLKAAFPSEQAVLCPPCLKPTYLMPEPKLSGQQYRGLTQCSGRD